MTDQDFIRRGGAGLAMVIVLAACASGNGSPRVAIGPHASGGQGRAVVVDDAFLSIFDKPDAPLSSPTAQAGSLDDATRAMTFTAVVVKALGDPDYVRFDSGKSFEMRWQSTDPQLVVVESNEPGLRSEDQLVSIAKNYSTQDAAHPNSAAMVELPQSRTQALYLSGRDPSTIIFIASDCTISVYTPSGTSQDVVVAQADAFAVAAGLGTADPGPR